MDGPLPLVELVVWTSLKRDRMEISNSKVNIDFAELACDFYFYWLKEKK